MAHLRETPPQRGRRKGEQGFTLIELLVVITIISILAAVVSVSVGGFITTANEKTRQAQFAAIQTAVDTYVSTHLDASGDLKQATYPLFTTSLVAIATGTGATSPDAWYGSDGKSITLSVLAASNQYSLVDLYGAGATDLVFNKYISVGATKAFGNTTTTGVKCAFVMVNGGTLGLAAAGITEGVAKTAVRTNLGKLAACRDADPASP